MRNRDEEKNRKMENEQTRRPSGDSDFGSSDKDRESSKIEREPDLNQSQVDRSRRDEH